MDTGMPIKQDVTNALKKLEIDAEYVVKGLKNFFEDEDNAGPSRLAALKTLGELAEIAPEEKDKGKNPFEGATFSGDINVTNRLENKPERKQLPGIQSADVTRYASAESGSDPK